MEELTSRRVLLRNFAWVCAAAFPAVDAGELEESGYSKPPIGLQLYTVGPEMSRSLVSTLKRIASIGYTEVELSSSRYSSKELKLTLRDLGLHSIAGHYNLPELTNNLQEKIDLAKEFGQEYMVLTWPWVSDESRFTHSPDNPLGLIRAVLQSLTLDDWKWNAEQFNKVGEQIKKAGLQFAYHNHNFEFKPLGERNGYDEILRLTDPELVKLELDCGWMAVAGADPVEYILKYPDRYRLLHARDFRTGFARTTNFMEEGPNAPTSTELGRGSIDYVRILKSTRKVKLRTIYVEQDPPSTQVSVFDSITADHKYLKDLLS